MNNAAVKPRGYDILRATADDAEALMLCAKRANHDNVLHQHMFPKDREHLAPPEATDAMWAARIRKRMADEDAYLFKVVDRTHQPGRVIGSSFWFTPGHFDKVDSALIALEYPANMRVEVYKEYGVVVDAKRREIWGENANYWYLGGLNVDPDYQRQGIARELLQWGLDQADAAGLPIYLESTPAGAPVYPKFGFEKRSEHALYDGKHVLRFYVRPARKAE